MFIQIFFADEDPGALAAADKLEAMTLDEWVF